MINLTFNGETKLDAGDQFKLNARVAHFEIKNV